MKKVEAPQRNEEIEDEAQNISKSNDRRTPAQIAFDRVKEKRVEYFNDLLPNAH